MTASLAPDLPSDEEDDGWSAVGGDRLPEEIVAPIVAGAYARGIAEMFERLALPAVFLDGDGRVLFVSEAARPFLHGALRIETQHLIATLGSDNRALSDLIAGTLSGAGDLRSATLPKPRLTLYGIALPRPAGAPGQLLRAAIVIDNGRDAGVATLARRMTGDRG